MRRVPNLGVWSEMPKTDETLGLRFKVPSAAPASIAARRCHVASYGDRGNALVGIILIIVVVLLLTHKMEALTFGAAQPKMLEWRPSS